MKIIDYDSGECLSGVNVGDHYSDFDGDVIIDINHFNDTVEISYISYDILRFKPRDKMIVKLKQL